MPRTSPHWNNVNARLEVIKKLADVKKRFAMLSFIDTCVYSFIVCLLLVSPVNATQLSTPSDTKLANTTNELNIYAAHITEDLALACEQNPLIHCEANILSQATLAEALLQIDTQGSVISHLENTEYEVLIGSAKLVDKQTNERNLKLEINVQWRGIEIDAVEISQPVEATDKIESVVSTTKQILNEWLNIVSEKDVFSARFLHQFLDASDYASELVVPAQIGDFALARQHLFNDPMQGMMSRYIHKDFELAVLDVYVYPLKNDDPIDIQSQSELLAEQHDIRMISEAFPENALNMSDIYEIESLSAAFGTRVFAFEASLNTKTEPLFATQYLFVQNDKVVRLSVNAPARISDPLVAQVIQNVQVPKESALMKQLRRKPVIASNASLTIETSAPQ